MLEFGRVYLGAAYGKRLEREAAACGVEIRYGHSVVQLGAAGEVLVSSNTGLETLSARRILVTTGVRELPRAARMVTGDRPVGVLTTGALQAYVAFHKLMPFRRPLIVGSELVTMSAILTCLTHGARPVAVLEPHTHSLVGAPFNWFPAMTGIPFHRGASIVDIAGSGRVEAVTFTCGGRLKTVACDGVLFSGRFLPEASLFQTSGFEVDRGSAGPAVDQSGRCENPIYFAAGNVLRAVETGGWAFREGRAIGEAIAGDLARDPSRSVPVRVSYDAPIKLVVPSLVRSGAPLPGGLNGFQLRFERRARGTLLLELDGKPVWGKEGSWSPEVRIRAPMPPNAAGAQQVHFRFLPQAGSGRAS
jgi:pyruvate/2-oxoglutarate dehydrogenase complex dihydrolipoamide dehydrogenase (E3) component